MAQMEKQKHHLDHFIHASLCPPEKCILVQSLQCSESSESSYAFQQHSCRYQGDPQPMAEQDDIKRTCQFPLQTKAALRNNICSEDSPLDWLRNLGARVIVPLALPNSTCFSFFFFSQVLLPNIILQFCFSPDFLGCNRQIKIVYNQCLRCDELISTYIVVMCKDYHNQIDQLIYHQT